jgi:hypothetical protein
MTDKVYPDEPCYGLFEGPKMRAQPDGSQQDRWLQQVWVIRGDAIACYEVDYGPATDFERVVPLVMPSAGDDTVAQLQAHAEKNRHDDYWAKRRDEMLAGSTLIEDHLRLLDEETAQLFNKSVFGPAVTVQRNNNNRQAITRHLRRLIKEHRNGN